MPASHPPLRQLGREQRPDARALHRSARALVVRAIREEKDAGSFMGRRAVAAVHQVTEDVERRLMLRVLASDEPTHRVQSLVAWAGHLEGTGSHREAATALDLAASVAPDEPSLVLHQARLARKTGDDARARVLYDLVAALDAGDGRFERLADVGHALVSREPEAALGRALRRARLADDAEASAVALEARAAERRRKGRVGGALRDYLAAATRYGDPVDLGRIGHEMADMLMGAGDVLAARVVLLETAKRAHQRQALWAEARLFVLSRAIHDEVGQRRWADAPTPPLTSLTVRSPSLSETTGQGSRHASLARWIDAVGALGG